MTSQEKALRDFAQFAAKLKGDEKSEAQTFLFHLLAANAHDANILSDGSDTVSDTFPWPQFPTDSALRTPHPALENVRAVAEAAVALRALRREILQANGWSLRDPPVSLESLGLNKQLVESGYPHGS